MSPLTTDETESDTGIVGLTGTTGIEDVIGTGNGRPTVGCEMRIGTATVNGTVNDDETGTITRETTGKAATETPHPLVMPRTITENVDQVVNGNATGEGTHIHAGITQDEMARPHAAVVSAITVRI